MWIAVRTEVQISTSLEDRQTKGGEWVINTRKKMSRDICVEVVCNNYVIFHQGDGRCPDCSLNYVFRVATEEVLKEILTQRKWKKKCS